MNVKTKLRRASLLTTTVALAALALAFAASGASASDACFDQPEAGVQPGYGIAPGCFDGQESAGGVGAGAYTQAGGAPDSLITGFEVNTRVKVDPGEGPLRWPFEPPRDVLVDTPPGLIGNPAAFAHCSADQLAYDQENAGIFGPLCPSASQIGTIEVFVAGGQRSAIPLFNMLAPRGAPARFGFNVINVVVVLDARLRADGDYGISVDSRGINQALPFTGARVTFWGVPADPSHTPQRACPGQNPPSEQGPACEAGVSPARFLRLPTSCNQEGEGMPWALHTDSWWNPGTYTASGAPAPGDANWKHATYASHLPPGLDQELLPDQWGEAKGTDGCELVPVKGQISAQPTSQNAETPTGLNVVVSVPNPGLENPAGIASSDIKKTVVSLPEGITLNPSQGEGLGVCTPAQYASSTVESTPGTGCPDSAKIGTVSVKTPLLEETLDGAVYIAQPYDNPSGSLLALYIVIANPQRGVIIKFAGKVAPDEETGQLISTFDGLPQLPFDSFTLHFREGVRSPLATPRACGTYTTTARFTPYSEPAHTIERQSSFEITHGVGGGACPSGAAAFNPGLAAGTINNNAGSYSPFTLRMIREDGEQEITNFSADLPPGLAAKLAGVPKCSEAALQATAEDSGANEISNPICPAASQVGRVTVGYGVGSVLTHATGRVFLAGPYHGTPLSIATVAPAVVGPFDLGTVLQRSAFRVDPETAEVHVDSRASDPIPHILKGVELHLRDIRVYMDRPNFTFNPTNCNPLAVGAQLRGSGADFASPTDDPLVAVSNPFQVSNCSLLPFKPKLAFKLKGGTKRGDFPALQATLRGRPGDANIAKAVVTLPKAEFIEQGHIRTVCTRVQFAAEQCPADSVYGHAKAITPLLDQPLEGPVYLRSNGGERLLPDLVATLRGEISINAVGYVDSVNGRVRTTFATVPDTPVTKFVLAMAGGRKGLLVNSRDICDHTYRAAVQMDGQNGKTADQRPVLRNSCGGVRKKHRGRR